jgi:hypothetical protein
MKRHRSTTVTAAVTAALALGLPGLASATDLTKFRTVFDTDFATAGVGGMRDGDGTGSLELAGVSGTVTSAYLYWHGPSNADPAGPGNRDVSFDGTDVRGTFLGVSSDNCWGFSNSLAYRADVTSLVAGNGTFALANFIKSGIQINGVSLVVFFDDGDDSNNRDVVMFDGNDSNINNSFDAPGWNITLAGIDYSGGEANAQFHVGDGQTFSDDAIDVNATELVPAGSVFQGDSVPAPGALPTHNGGLWDIKSFSVTSLLSPGLNTLNVTTGVASDCLACMLIAIDLPAGAAPPEPPPGVPEPGSLALLGLGLTGLGMARRRRA